MAALNKNFETFQPSTKNIKKIHTRYIFVLFKVVENPEFLFSSFADSTPQHKKSVPLAQILNFTMMQNSYSYWISLSLLLEKTLFHWLEQCLPIGPFCIPRGNLRDCPVNEFCDLVMLT